MVSSQHLLSKALWLLSKGSCVEGGPGEERRGHVEWSGGDVMFPFSPQYAQQWSQYYQGQGQWPPYYGSYDYGGYSGSAQGGASTQ